MRESRLALLLQLTPETLPVSGSTRLTPGFFGGAYTMAQVKQSNSSALPPLVIEAARNVVMPAFSFAPFMGRKPLDTLDTDLVLVTKLYRTAVPAALHVRDGAVAERIKVICKSDFLGKKGDSRLLEVPLPNARGKKGRYVHLLGLGPASGYCGQTACGTFEEFFKKALELGVERVTLPFIPNPMTKTSLSHKLTAFKMKKTLLRVLQGHKGPVALKEVQIYCHPAAVRSIQEGLDAEQGDDCRCTTK